MYSSDARTGDRPRLLAHIAVSVYLEATSVAMSVNLPETRQASIEHVHPFGSRVRVKLQDLVN